MNVDNFRKMYVAELQELHSVEEQLAQALPKMMDKARNADLKNAIKHHLDETRAQRDRLERVIRGHQAEAREHQDSAMQAIIREADRWAGMVEDDELRDAGLIASAQRVEHYEMAVYGTLATWAKQLGFDDDLKVLLEILEEEKAADQKLSMLAKQDINPQAAHA